MSADPYDLVVIGGGPAGSTLATLVKQYAPERKVLLLDKDAGPRHHTGESLQPGIRSVLKEMGVLDSIDKAGFPRKLGATYIWGRDRKPWENLFNKAKDQSAYPSQGAVESEVGYAWQVKRSQYDDILLRHAAKAGVEIRRGVQATSILEEGGRVTGTRAKDALGREFTVRSGVLADCSGQSGFLSKFRRIREYNPSMKNLAAYVYFKGARWKYQYTGRPRDTKLFVCTVGCGWFWYIPLDGDIVSVGLVTKTDYIKKNRLDVRDLFFKELRKCKEIWPLLKDAVQVSDYEGTGRDFFTQSDWSYLNVESSGPGWLAAGDAAMFVDPILASGVMLAHLAAHRAAYTLLTSWKEPDERVSALMWRDYSTFCREFAAQFMVLALFWYGNDRRAERWWAQAKEIQRAWLPVNVSAKTAFITVSSGLSHYYQRFFSSSNMMKETATDLRDVPFYQAVLKGDLDPQKQPDSIPELSRVPRLLYPYREEFSFLPVYGKGRLQPAKRVRFIKKETQDILTDAYNPKVIVTRYHLELLKAIDGRRTLEQALQEAARQGVPSHWLDEAALMFVKELAIQGVLRFRGAGKAPVRRLERPLPVVQNA